MDQPVSNLYNCVRDMESEHFRAPSQVLCCHYSNKMLCRHICILMPPCPVLQTHAHVSSFTHATSPIKCNAIINVLNFKHTWKCLQDQGHYYINVYCLQERLLEILLMVCYCKS